MPPEMDHHTTPLPPHKHLAEAQDAKARPIVPLSFANGALRKHCHRPIQPRPRRYGQSQGDHAVYRQCMKNHAASLGGHALDGCGEFMPSAASIPAEPASLTCAACGCHRNFHRRLLHGAGAARQQRYREETEEDSLDEECGDDAGGDDDEGGRSSSPPPTAASNQYCSSGPHMLMALSAGLPGGPVDSSGLLTTTPGPNTTAKAARRTAPGAMGGLLPRKRFRTKFSAEQKARMQEVCGRLGWRLQKRDEALVEQCCREIGVSRGVFKVWMHNNKHTFVGGPRRGGGGGSGGGGGGAGSGGGAVYVNGVSDVGGVCVKGDERCGEVAVGGDGGDPGEGCSVHVANDSSLSS